MKCKLFSPVWKRCFKSDTRFPFNDFGGQKCVCADGDTFKVWRKYIQKQKQQQFKTYSNTSYYWYGSHFVRISRYGCSSFFFFFFFFSAQLSLLKDKAILRMRRQRAFLKNREIAFVMKINVIIEQDHPWLNWVGLVSYQCWYHVFSYFERDNFFIHFCSRELTIPQQ